MKLPPGTVDEAFARRIHRANWEAVKTDQTLQARINKYLTLATYDVKKRFGNGIKEQYVLSYAITDEFHPLPYYRGKMVAILEVVRFDRFGRKLYRVLENVAGEVIPMNYIIVTQHFHERFYQRAGTTELKDLLLELKCPAMDCYREALGAKSKRSTL